MLVMSIVNITLMPDDTVKATKSSFIFTRSKACRMSVDGFSMIRVSGVSYVSRSYETYSHFDIHEEVSVCTVETFIYCLSYYLIAVGRVHCVK